MIDVKDFVDKDNKIAVVGVSSNREKWGYKIYKNLKSLGYNVYAVNPKYDKIEEERCYPDLKSLPEKPDVVITVVPPKVTEKIIEECKKLGIKRIWMQPGSESEKAIKSCEKYKIIVAHHICFLMDGLQS